MGNVDSTGKAFHQSLSLAGFMNKQEKIPLLELKFPIWRIEVLFWRFDKPMDKSTAKNDALKGTARNVDFR